MSKSQFQRYWSRIDNCPGSLEHLNKEQAAELKRMVKQAFHAGHQMYRNRIAELEADNERLKGDRMCAVKEGGGSPCDDAALEAIAAIRALPDELSREFMGGYSVPIHVVKQAIDTILSKYDYETGN